MMNAYNPYPVANMAQSGMYGVPTAGYAPMANVNTMMPAMTGMNPILPTMGVSMTNQAPMQQAAIIPYTGAQNYLSGQHMLPMGQPGMVPYGGAQSYLSGYQPAQNMIPMSVGGQYMPYPMVQPTPMPAMTGMNTTYAFPK